MDHPVPRKLFFKNYDYIEDDSGIGPGGGLYSNMQKYKSVSDFLKKKRKRRKKAFLAIAIDWTLDQQNLSTIENSDGAETANIMQEVNLSGGLYDHTYPFRDPSGKSWDSLNINRDLENTTITPGEQSLLNKNQISKSLTQFEPPHLMFPGGILPNEDLDSLYKRNPDFGVTNTGTVMHNDGLTSSPE